MSVRPIECKCTAGVVSLECVRRGRDQPWASRPACYTGAAVGAQAGCFCGSWAWWGNGGEYGSRERLRELASVRTNSCGVKAGEICSRSVEVCWLLVLFMAIVASFICKTGYWALRFL